MSKSRATEAYRQQEYILAWKEHWLYRKLFKWYGDAYLKAKSPGILRHPPAFEPALREVVARARKEWTERTRLPALDPCDPETWWTAAVAATMHGQPVPNVRELSARGLIEIILPWALAQTAAIEQTADPATGPLPILELVDVKLLRILADRPGVAHSQYDLLKAGDRKTIGLRLRHLRTIGYVAHPDGRKKGNVITPEGVARLQTIAETSP